MNDIAAQITPPQSLTEFCFYFTSSPAAHYDLSHLFVGLMLQGGGNLSTPRFFFAFVYLS